jgi:phosphatidylglycerol:prolipoprotein diacylglycerol transferase
MHPVLLNLGGFEIYTYGFFVAVAALCSYFMAVRRAPRFDIGLSDITDLFFFVFVAGILGARVFYVLQHRDEFQGRFWHVFSLREGGLVWYGGFIGATVGGVLLARFRRWPILRLCDLVAPIVPAAHAFGRIGCFFNGCCYGRITNASHGVVFYGDSDYRLPVQLYEAGFLFALSTLLFLIPPRKREGQLFFLYVGFYGAARFTLEFFRGDQLALRSFTLPQWTSVVLAAGAAYFYWSLDRKRPGVSR